MITQGRILYGYEAAGFSRYTTFDLLALLGVYLALLDRRRAHDAGVRPRTSGVRHRPGADRTVEQEMAVWTGVLLPCARLSCCRPSSSRCRWGSTTGSMGQGTDHANDIVAAATLRNIDHVSDTELIRALIVSKPPSWIREQAKTLEEHRLNVFANG